MAHLPVPIARIRVALRDFLDQQRSSGRLRDGDLLLVGCSGGADSVALAASLAFLAPRMGLRAGLVTVDHGLQVGSEAQAQAVVELGETLGLKPALACTAERGDPTGYGPEGDARELRYTALAQAISRTGATAVLLGHTMEDQAETVLLGLSRGAGTRAVAGMPAVRERFWRPLLTVRRADTEAACAAAGLAVWEDPTNTPDGPWRTADGDALPRAALRYQVLPELAAALGQDPVPALARTGYLAREDSDYLEELARDLHRLFVHVPLAELRRGPDGGGERTESGGGKYTESAGGGNAEPATAAPRDAAVSGAGERGSKREVSTAAGASDAVWAIEIAALAELPPALRWRVLRELIIRAGAPPAQVSMTHVHGVDSLITDWRGQRGISLPLGRQARRTYGRLYVVSPSNLESP